MMVVDDGNILVVPSRGEPDKKFLEDARISRLIYHHDESITLFPCPLPQKHHPWGLHCFSHMVQ